MLTSPGFFFKEANLSVLGWGCTVPYLPPWERTIQGHYWSYKQNIPIKIFVMNFCFFCFKLFCFRWYWWWWWWWWWWWLWNIDAADDDVIIWSWCDDDDGDIDDDHHHHDHHHHHHHPSFIFFFFCSSFPSFEVAKSQPLNIAPLSSSLFKRDAPWNHSSSRQNQRNQGPYPPAILENILSLFRQNFFFFSDKTIWM